MAHTFQWLSLPFLTSCLIWSLINLKNNFFSAKILSTICSQIIVTLLVLVTKLCICFDNTSGDPPNGDAFSGLTTKYVVLLSFILSINTVFSYVMFDSHLLSFISIIVLTLIQIWATILAVKMWRKFRDIEPQSDQIYWSEAIVDFPHSVRKHYQNLLGEKSILEPIGWTPFATTFRTENTEEVKGIFHQMDNEYVFKIIDIKEFVKFLYGSQSAEEESEEVRKFNRDYKFLMQINQQNIARIIRADRFSSKSGQIKRLVLVTKLATRSLHSYLKLDVNDGVQQDLARLWFTEVVSAVHYLHCQLNKDQPIAHMNIKPENILLFRSNEESLELKAKLSECGLDLYFPKSGQITTDENKYLISAPEYVIGRRITRFQLQCQKKEADPLAADVYSLGVILVLLLKGKIENWVQNPRVNRMREMATVLNSIYVDFSWKNSKNTIRKSFVNKEDKNLMHLLKGLLGRKPETRLDILTVKNHPWLHTKQTLFDS